MQHTARIFVLILVTTSILLGCAANKPLMTINPQPSAGQDMVYTDGVAMLRSIGSVSVLASAEKAIPDDSENVELLLMFLNRSDQPINIISSDVKAYDHNGSPLKVLTPEEQSRAVDKKYKWQRVGLALQGMGAGMQGNETAYHSGTIDGKTYSGTTTYSTDNTQAQQQFHSDVKSLNSAVGAEKSEYLRNHTLYPEQVYSGEVWVASPNSSEPGKSITLEIPLDTEVHSFTFVLQSASP